MDTDSFILSVKTKYITKGKKTLEEILDFRNLDKIMIYLVIKTRKLWSKSN